MEPERSQWLYVSGQEPMNERLLKEGLAQGQTREILKDGKDWYFCRLISGTDYYVVIRIFSEDVMDTYIKNRTYILVIR